MEQILFFEKNIIDITKEGFTLTIEDSVAADKGETSIDFIRNRNNASAWVTTDSTDAAQTEIIITFTDALEVDAISDIILVNHNFKKFLIYASPVPSFFIAYNFNQTDGSGNISPDNNEETTSHFHVNPTSGAYRYIKIKIYETMEVDADKFLAQLLLVKRVGQFEGWPKIEKPMHGLAKVRNKVVSGKYSISRGQQSFRFSLSTEAYSGEADLELIEKLFNRLDSFLVWICGGDTDQFFAEIQGYRKKDVYVMKLLNDYSPELYNGLYKSGIPYKLDFVEVVD